MSHKPPLPPRRPPPPKPRTGPPGLPPASHTAAVPAPRIPAPSAPNLNRPAPTRRPDAPPSTRASAEQSFIGQPPRSRPQIEDGPSVEISPKVASGRPPAAKTLVSSGNDESIDQLLQNAPAAVRAAADQVVAAHAAHGGLGGSLSGVSQPSAPARPYVPAPSPPAQDDAATVTLREGMTVAGRYRVDRMIGRGGMGTVYAVRHVNTGEKLALKLLHPALAENDAAVSRFRTEARAPVQIESEHVVRVVDADVAEDIGRIPFMVMERLKGFDLRGELKRRGALPAGEVVLYFKQVARALDKAHANGIIHRDLKPANMYVVRREDGSPHVKVLDFGIAKLTDDAARELTMAGQVFGTPWYMAPEQAKGELGLVGPATDLWALGLIAFQLLTGQNYWTADGMAALVAQICYEPMPPPTQRAPHLGPLFDMWFARACNRDPSQRFQTARELVDHLAQALGVNQTGPNISTDGGSLRHGDSSLQLSVPMSTNPPNLPGQALAAKLGQSALNHPQLGMSIPGTQRFDMTAAPLYSTRQPPQVKSNPIATAAVGVVVALLIGAAGVGVYLVLPAEGDNVAASPAAHGETPTDPAPVAAVDESADAADEPAGEADDDAEAVAENEDGDDETEAEPEPEPKDEEPKPEKVATKPAPTPAPGASPPPKAWVPKPPPAPPAPKVAPKVGNVTF